MTGMITPLRRYADFQGRSSRSEYWMFVLFQMLLYVIPVTLMIGGLAPGGADHSKPGFAFTLGMFFIFLLVIGLFIPNLAVQVRRLHDQDKSGWLLLISLIPYLGGLVMFVFMLLPGTTGSNRFGPDPRETWKVADVFN